MGNEWERFENTDGGSGVKWSVNHWQKDSERVEALEKRRRDELEHNNTEDGKKPIFQQASMEAAHRIDLQMREWFYSFVSSFYDARQAPLRFVKVITYS